MKKVLGVLISGIMIVGMTGCSSSDDTSQDLTTQQSDTTSITEPVEEVSTKPDNAIEEGIYKVGSDIEAGTYALTTESGRGYYCISTDNLGDDILANDNFVENAFITIQDGQFLKLSNCFMIPEVEKEAIEIDGNEIGEGIYRVGKDIPAGDYALTTQTSNGYYCISSDNLGNDILANDNFKDNAYITIQDGQFLKLSNCTMVSEDEKEVAEVNGNEIGEGIYRVGKDIPAGDYALTTQTSNGYYCISSDNLGNDILANDNFKNNAYITIEDGQFLKLSNCTMVPDEN